MCYRLIFKFSFLGNKFQSLESSNLYAARMESYEKEVPAASL